MSTGTPTSMEVTHLLAQLEHMDLCWVNTHSTLSVVVLEWGFMLLALILIPTIKHVTA